MALIWLTSSTLLAGSSIGAALSSCPVLTGRCCSGPWFCFADQGLRESFYRRGHETGTRHVPAPDCQTGGGAALRSYRCDGNGRSTGDLSIYPYLGSSRLAEVVDRHGADLIVHGHAHHGSLSGKTTGGIPVHNVAITLLQA